MGLNTPITFFEWLKARRRALDLTQCELALRVGCSVGAVRKIEAGDRRPSKQLAGLLAKALEIPVKDQPAFIRIARGELNLERLDELSLKPVYTFSEVSNLPQNRSGETLAENPTSPSSSHHIPLQATPLIGRGSELAAMERLFNDPECRLLTLTGIGGIGKTSLAIGFALRKQAAFPGGVFYIPLAPVNSPEKIVPSIADVLGIGFSGPTDPQEQLLNTISNRVTREALFILDNLEHLLVQIPSEDDRFSLVELIVEIMRRSPNVKILGTSRERLNIHGEWTYELHGLSVPPAAFVGRAEQYDSIALFVESAQRIRSDFQISAEEQQSLVQISQLVEGVPLAIELAAAWVGILSCQEIAREIKSNMNFLTTSMRDIPERHRSMQAAFDHSWRLISDEERWALCQLSVFHGGFDRNAAHQIAGASLPILASLCAKSLVRRTDTGRFDLHEIIRQFTLSHLHKNPQQIDPYNRHCKYYLNLVSESEKYLKNGGQQDAIRHLTDEIDNIRAAWIWAKEHNNFDQLGRAGRGFGWYFEISGLYRDGIEQFDSLAESLGSMSLDNEKGRLFGLTLIHQALLYFRKGEFDTARRLYEKSIYLLRPTGDQSLLADSLGFLGTILHLQGEYERARSLLGESLICAQQTNEQWFVAWAIYNLGHIKGLIGHYEVGYEQMLAGLGMWRALGDPQAIALGLNFLIPTLIKLGRYEEAKGLMHESISLCEQSKNRWGMGTAYRFLGLTNLAKGEFKEAQAHLLRSLEIFGEFAVGWDIARSLTYLGDASILGGDLAEAKKYYTDAVCLSLDANAAPIALDGLLGLASLHAQAGRVTQALEVCYYILSHTSSEQATKSRAEQLCQTLELKLNPDQVKMTRTGAQNITLDTMVRESLENL